MNKSLKITIALVVALAAAAWLAFGFFGIQAAFIDDEVSEANPFTTSAAPADGQASPAPDVADAPQNNAADDSIDVTPADVTQPSTNTTQTTDAAGAVQELEDDAAATNDAAPPTSQTAESQTPAEAQIVTLATGSLVDHAHAGDGTVTVLTDGTQRFLRFEDDFAIDNGPDLNVYLVRGVDAEGPTGLFDDDFIDLGDLKGNIGAQNYELAADVDLAEYKTVVIWCVRFGVAFNAADLA